MHESAGEIVRVVRDETRIKFVFEGTKGSDSQAGYVFFGREFVMGTDPADFFCEYGCMYPFNMVGFFDGKRAVAVIVDDDGFKSIHIHKDEVSCFCEFGFSVPAERVPLRIKEYDMSRHILRKMIAEYRAWYAQKYGKLPKSSADLAGCFNVKRYFFNRSDRFFGSFFEAPRAIFDEGKIALGPLLEEDNEKLGSVDVALLFDYAFKDGIRCGNREPFPFGKELLGELNEAIEKSRKERGTRFFAYFDPCFVEFGSDWDRKYREQLMLRSESGLPVSVWGEGIWQPDLSNSIWQEECSNYLREVVAGLDVDGIYLDEIGNGTQIKGKVRGEDYAQLNAESEFVDHLQRNVESKSWMCEYPPAAKEAVKLDMVLSDTRTLVNIYRFIFPELKFVRVINCDMPIGNSIHELNKALFNGEGIWLDHDVRNEKWYPEKLKKVIREHTLFKKQYAAYFESTDAEHCISSGRKIAVNRLGYEGKNLYLIINDGDTEAECELCMERAEEARLVYGNGCELRQGKGRVLVRMPAYSVGSLWCR